MRNERLLNDLISLKGFKMYQCRTRIQTDGFNCGVIALKVKPHLLRTCSYVSYNKIFTVAISIIFEG